MGRRTETAAAAVGVGKPPRERRERGADQVLGGKSRVNLMFRAFSERTRLRILYLLRPGELCVGDLVEILRIPQPSASRHLSYLKRAGLVAARREGLWSFYRLAGPAGPFHEKLLACLGVCFGDVPEIARDVARAKKVRRSGGCCPR